MTRQLNSGRARQDNDTIELRMPFTFHLDHVADQPNVASRFYETYERHSVYLHVQFK